MRLTTVVERVYGGKEELGVPGTFFKEFGPSGGLIAAWTHKLEKNQSGKLLLQKLGLFLHFPSK